MGYGRNSVRFIAVISMRTRRSRRSRRSAPQRLSFSMSLCIDGVARSPQQPGLAIFDVVTEFYDAVRVQNEQRAGFIDELMLLDEIG